MSTTSPQGIEEAGSRIVERRERQRNEARQAILDATEELIIETGGSNFSIRSLGQRSGYSAPTVYHYFTDKDGLIDETEFGGMLDDLGWESPAETRSLEFAAIDGDLDGQVDFQEFADWWLDQG